MNAEDDAPSPAWPSDTRRLPAGPAGVALALCAALLTGACFGGVDGSGTGIDEPDEWTVTVSLTNVGDGAGGIDVAFSDGDVDNPCPDVLEPDDSCRVMATHRDHIESVMLDVEPDPFSEFAGYGGACSGPDATCEIQVVSETTVSLDVRLDFELVVHHVAFTPNPLAVAVGADTQVEADAWADNGETRPVESAIFTWGSSDPAVANVTGAGTSATVSGVQAGEAWIRATARGTTDSVQVVVAGG